MCEESFFLFLDDFFLILSLILLSSELSPVDEREKSAGQRGRALSASSKRTLQFTPPAQRALLASKPVHKSASANQLSLLIPPPGIQPITVLVTDSLLNFFLLSLFIVASMLVQNFLAEFKPGVLSRRLVFVSCFFSFIRLK